MLYQLIFEGRTVAGEPREAVRDRLATLLRVEPRKIDDLFDNPPTVIKKDLERIDARRYQAAFEKTGALCEIAPMEEVEPVEADPVELAPAPPLVEAEPELYRPSESIAEPVDETSSRFGMMVPIVAMLVIAGYMAWRSSPVSHGPGDVAPHDPIQIKLDSPAPFPHKGYTVKPLASFQIEARVLSTERYRMDDGADLVPWDFALGWGPMSNEEVIDKLTIRQGARFYTWTTREFPIPKGDIEVHSANMHLIPADGSIASKMGKARKGHIVKLSGYLVRASRGNGWHWKSSMTRDDTGAGACELVWVDSIEIR